MQEGSASPKPRKNRLMDQLNAKNRNQQFNADQLKPNNGSSTKYLEFSLNESDHNKFFQSVRFSSPSQASPNKMKTPTKRFHYGTSTPSKHSF
jgi:hypothetical protein